MLKRLLGIFIFALPLMGCSSVLYQKYSALFNTAVAEDKAVTIISEEPFENLKDKVLLKAMSLGYEKAVVSKPDQGFIVTVKKISGKTVLTSDAFAFPILLKFTKAEEGKTRLDLVNGAYNILAKKEVQKDIQILSEFVRSA